MRNVAKLIMAGAVGGVLTLAVLVMGIFGGQSVSADDPATEIQTAQQHLEITINDNVGTIIATDTQHLEITITNNVGSIIATATHHLVITVAVDPLDVMSATHLFQITVNDPNAIALTVDKTDVDLSGAPGLLLSDYVTVNVITGNPSGYNLSVEASEPRLKCYTSNDYIEPLFSVGVMANNHWGYAVDDGSLTVPSSWTGVTVTSVPFKTLGVATDPYDGDDTVLWLGAQADWAIPACRYSGVITITAAGN